MGRKPDVVRVRVVLAPGGWLEEVSASGHAGDQPAGSNLACAAVTVLVRTAYETLAQYDGVDIAGEAPEPGQLAFRLRRYSGADAGRLLGVRDFLLAGLSGIEREFPGAVDVSVEHERRQ